MPAPPAERAKGTPPLAGLQRPTAPLVSSSSQENPLENLLQKQTDRRTLLKLAGVAALGLVFGGLSGEELLAPIRGDQVSAKEKNLTTQEIFANLEVSEEEVLEKPRTVSGFSFDFDPTTGEITAISANAATGLGYIPFITTRENNSGFTPFEPRLNTKDIPKDMFPESIIRRPGSISIGGKLSGRPAYYTYNGQTWVAELVPANYGTISEQLPLISEQLPLDDDVTLLHGAGINVRDKHGNIIGLSEITYAVPPFTARRIGNQVIGYTRALGGKLKEFIIGNIHNPRVDAINEISMGGSPIAFDVQWGPDRAEEIYVAVSGPNVLRVINSRGDNVLPPMPFSLLGVAYVYSVRVIDKDRVLIGGVGGGGDHPVTKLVLLDLKSNTKRELIVAPQVPSHIVRQSNMRVGRIGENIVAIAYLQGNDGKGYGLFAQEIDPRKMEFVDEPFWPVNGLGELHENHLPLVMNNYRQ